MPRAKGYTPPGVEQALFCRSCRRYESKAHVEQVERMIIAVGRLLPIEYTIEMIAYLEESERARQ